MHQKMKKSLILFIGLCGGIACGIVYLNKQKTAPIPAPVAESSTAQPAVSAPAEITPAPKPSTAAVTAPAVTETAQATATASTVVEAKAADTANPIHQKVDALLSAKSAADKHAVFDDLVKSGHIDDAIADLKQRMADSPTDAEIPTTLGEAQLNKLRAIKEAGGDINDLGILAMEADKSFNAALKIDPQNWEANFVKASSMYYWPADPTRDNDVVQRLSGLIDQQETMTANPAFAQTYLILGNEYQKMGQPDKATATWQLGLTKFPNDPTLQKKVNGQ
jgi:tetratricopeptide (TPR) repeat protein